MCTIFLKTNICCDIGKLIPHAPVLLLLSMYVQNSDYIMHYCG